MFGFRAAGVQAAGIRSGGGDRGQSPCRAGESRLRAARGPRGFLDRVLDLRGRVPRGCRETQGRGTVRSKILSGLVSTRSAPCVCSAAVSEIVVPDHLRTGGCTSLSGRSARSSHSPRLGERPGKRYDIYSDTYSTLFDSNLQHPRRNTASLLFSFCAPTEASQQFQRGQQLASLVPFLGFQGTNPIPQYSFRAPKIVPEQKLDELPERFTHDHTTAALAKHLPHCLS